MGKPVHFCLWGAYRFQRCDKTSFFCQALSPEARRRLHQNSMR